MAKKSKSKDTSNQIASNRKAYHDYSIQTKYTAGLILEGWEVKSLREGRVQLKESYVILKGGAAFLFGAHISPLNNTCTHYTPDPLRTRKLLLHQREIDVLIKAKEQQGYTIVPLNMHWSKKYAKLSIAIAKGKQQHDKREAHKKADWQRQQHQLLKHKQQ